MYAFYIAASHLVWNLTSPHGEGLAAGLLQLGLFSLPAAALLLARPPRAPEPGSVIGVDAEEARSP